MGKLLCSSNSFTWQQHTNGLSHLALDWFYEVFPNTDGSRKGLTKFTGPFYVFSSHWKSTCALRKAVVGRLLMLGTLKG